MHVCMFWAMLSDDRGYFLSSAQGLFLNGVRVLCGMPKIESGSATWEASALSTALFLWPLIYLFFLNKVNHSVLWKIKKGFTTTILLATGIFKNWLKLKLVILKKYLIEKFVLLFIIKTYTHDEGISQITRSLLLALNGENLIILTS